MTPGSSDAAAAGKFAAAAGPAKPAPGEPEKIASLPLSATPDGENGIGLTQLPGDSREARLRALFALFFHEAGLIPDDNIISALAAAMRRMGYAFVPVRR